MADAVDPVETSSGFDELEEVVCLRCVTPVRAPVLPCPRPGPSSYGSDGAPPGRAYRIALSSRREPLGVVGTRARFPPKVARVLLELEAAGAMGCGSAK